MNRIVELFLIVELYIPINLVISAYSITNIPIQFITLVILPYFSLINHNCFIFTNIFLYSLLFLKGKPNKLKEHRKETGKELEIVRCIVIILVTIAIFACDFSNFPKRFFKSKFYGCSLMDLGVGSFLFNNGLTIHLRKKSSILKSAFFLFLLGFLRLFVILFFNYSVDLNEYGFLFNFYFVLSFVYLIYLVVGKKYNLFVSIFIGLIYQYCLNCGLDSFILSDERNSFLKMNKEGIFMILPSYCILVLSEKLGKIVFFITNDSQKKEKEDLLCVYKVFLFFLISLFVYSFVSEKILPCRRQCNFTFIIFIILFHSVQVFFIKLFRMFYYLPCEFVLFCGKNMLNIFLWSNFLVLIFNLRYDLQSFGDKESVICNLFYLTSSFLAPYYFKKLIKKEVDQ
ncbi:hypothetical protein TUBRATIS_15020 [Tubulinosema ratisbonensis]|uniref:GPI-anchored wall transfer protein 1 n=1 Tax=Tubulinosema ratisbonensis TaxID=291195 RepID=A0A437ALE9_9MICR|nr:hypothetical protein TUBRATIS_15020 [Tubulinosema ratisbonensis]